MSASTGHLRPASAGEARRRAFALALPALGMLALIATLPMGGAAIAVGSALFAGTCVVGLVLAPRPSGSRSTSPPSARRSSGRSIARSTSPRHRRAWLSLVAFVAIVWFIPIRVYTLPAPGPVKLEPYRLMVLLLAVALVLGAIAGARRIRACGLGGALLTLSASAVISLAVNYSSFTERLLGTEATKAATYLLTFPIVFVLVASGVRSRADVERCIKAIVVGGAVVAFCAIIETRTQYNVFNHLRTVFPFLQDTGERATEVRNGALRAEASAQHPIALGVALSLCLPLSLALMLRVRDTARRVLFSGCALILVIGMVATISRTAFLALAVMLLVGLMTERRRLTRLWPLTIVLLIAAHTVLPGRPRPPLPRVLPQGRHHGRAVRSRRRRRLRPAGRPASGAQARAGQRLLRHRRPAAPAARPGAEPRPDRGRDAARSDHLRRPVPDLAGRPRRVRPGRGALARRRDVFPLIRASRRARGSLPLLSACTASVAGFAAAMLTFDAFAFVQCSIFFFVIAALGLRLAQIDRPQPEAASRGGAHAGAGALLTPALVAARPGLDAPARVPPIRRRSRACRPRGPCRPRRSA